ncbi:MAG: dynamin family protein [Bacteroidales bacterium]|nr:dynamin family protein [Bacteroidales bacterium]
MATIKDQVDEIIASRRDILRPQYEKFKEQANSIWDFIVRFNELKNKVESHKCALTDTQEKEFEELTNRFSEFCNTVNKNLGKDKNNIDGYMQAVKSKLDKDEIDICIMGPVSSGKSTFLQKLTGLRDDCIPTGGAATTATRTNIVNGDKYEAKIAAYTEEEIIEIVNEYVKLFNSNGKKGTNIPVVSLDLKSGIKEISNYIEENGGEEYKPYEDAQDHKGIKLQNYYDTFRMYVDHINDYQEVINYPEKFQSVPQEELKEFVSYIPNPNDDNKIDKAKSLGVKYVDLKCNLGDDLGKIKLIDTMGMGEAKFNVEDNLLSTINQTADLAIALCRMKDNGESTLTNKNNDVSFISVLGRIKDRKIEDWCFYCINTYANVTDKDKISNLQNAIKEYAQKLQNSISFRTEHFLSCNFKEEGTKIKEFFRTEVLGNLKKCIGDVDKYLVDKLKECITMLEEQKDSMLKKIQNLEKGIVVEDEFVWKEKKYNAIKLQICDAINNKIEDMNSKNDEDFVKPLNDALKSLFQKSALFECLKCEKLQEKYINKFNEKGNNGLFSQILKEKSESFFKSLNSKEGNSIDQTTIDNFIKDLKNSEKKQSVVDEFIKKNVTLTSIKDQLMQGVGGDSSQAIENNVKKILSDLLNKSEETIDITEGIKKLQYKRGANQDPKNIDRGGREMSSFLACREDVYVNVCERVEKATIIDDKQGNQQVNENNTLADKLNTKLSTYRKSIMDEIVNVLRNNNCKIQKDVKFDELFSDNVNLNSFMEYFNNKKIKLTQICEEIGTSKEADAKLITKLFDVELKYQNVQEAYKCFFINLFKIDYVLRVTLCKMFEDVFLDENNKFRLFEYELANDLNKLFNYRSEMIVDEINSEFVGWVKSKITSDDNWKREVKQLLSQILPNNK